MKKLIIISMMLMFTSYHFNNAYAGNVPFFSEKANLSLDFTDTSAGEISTNKSAPQGMNHSSARAVSAQLISFKLAVRNQAAEVIWVTQNESNIQSFILESSIDGINFFRFAQIPAVGKFGSINNYRGIDELPKNTNFYRLKMIDYSGNEFYSKTVAVQKAK